jgi:serine/threonine protein kinase
MEAALAWQVGSRLYMAPEILFNARGGYTAKADLWSVGCIAFELLHGRAPYGSAPRSTEADLRRDIAEDRRFARDPPPALTEPCRDLLEGLLRRDPAERLPSRTRACSTTRGSAPPARRGRRAGAGRRGRGGGGLSAGRYAMSKALLGEGSFATVYRGSDEETGGAVAVKKVSWMKIRWRSPELIERHQQNLRNKMECLQSLDHPNIVKLLGLPRPPRPPPPHPPLALLAPPPPPPAVRPHFTARRPPAGADG